MLCVNETTRSLGNHLYGFQHQYIYDVKKHSFNLNNNEFVTEVH